MTDDELKTLIDQLANSLQTPLLLAALPIRPRSATASSAGIRDPCGFRRQAAEVGSTIMAFTVKDAVIDQSCGLMPSKLHPYFDAGVDFARMRVG